MKSIWKFELAKTDLQVFEMPVGAKILAVQSQGGNSPCIWALVDTDAVKEQRSFTTYGTGHPFNENYKQEYLGTYQLMNGSLVFHVFELLDHK